MRNILIALGVLLLLGIVAFFYFKNIWNKITFEFEKAFRGINLSSFNVQDLLFKGQTVIHPTLSLNIKNDNNEPIPFKEMVGKIFYGGALIAETSQDLYAKDFVLPANSSLTVTDTINLYLNQAGGKLLLEKVKGNPQTLSYTINIKIKIFGWLWLPVSYDGEFTW